MEESIKTALEEKKKSHQKRIHTDNDDCNDNNIHNYNNNNNNSW